MPMSQCKVNHKPFKRCFDIIFSSSALLFLAPFFLTVALLIRSTSRGKAIYSHERIGRCGKKFRCFKFRTMYQDADERLNKILQEDSALRNEWHLTRKLKNDPRITAMGKFLRKTSLDELPQFWNVLRGDLSVVGPRPVLEEEILKYYGVKAPKILSVRPGITGIWQVSGRNDTSYAKRVELDEQYVERQSFFLDMKLIIKTVPCMVSRKGAY